MLVDDRPDPRELMGQLRGLRDETGFPAAAAALHLLAHIEMPEVQAERLLADLLRHRDDVAGSLGRDPGLRVAAIDYLSNVKRLLANPAIVERSQLEQAERSAITDPLTRLYNRRHLMAALSRELRRSQRYALRLSLLMLDLDEFKRLNDEHGHAAGDAVLQQVARILRRAVREADVPCRFGGEEFAVILPETDRLGAYAVAERTRARIERLFQDGAFQGLPARLGLSGGIACYPDDGQNPATLVARADQALYLAKERGKNRISLFHSEQRRAVRYPARPAATVRILVRRGRAVPARPIDLSLTGGLLEAEAQLNVASPVELAFRGRDGEFPGEWTVTGRIVRAEPIDAERGIGRFAVAFDESLPEDCLREQVQAVDLLRAAHAGQA